MTSQRVYGGRSGQERQETRRSQLIEAGRELLATEGITNTTVRAVCAKSGLTDRYFYESFANKELLVDAVFDRIASELAAEVFAAAAASEGDLRARLSILIRRSIEGLISEPAIRRLTLEAGANSALLRTQDALITRIVEITEQYAPVLVDTGLPDGPAPHATALFAIAGANGMISAWINGSLTVTQDELIELATDLMASAISVVLTTDSNQPPAWNHGRPPAA